MRSRSSVDPAESIPNHGTDARRLSRACRRLREGVRAMRAEMHKLRAEYESDGGIPVDVKTQEAKVADLERQAHLLLSRAAANSPRIGESGSWKKRSSLSGRT